MSNYYAYDDEYGENLRWSGLILAQDINEVLESRGITNVRMSVDDDLDVRGWVLQPELDDETVGLGLSVDAVFEASEVRLLNGASSRFTGDGDWNPEYESLVNYHADQLEHLAKHGELPLET